MTMLDIAQAMRGKLRDGYSAPQAGGAAMTSEMAYGTARADSVGGFVEIVMDNMPSGADPDDYAFTVACDAPISANDRVALVTINGTSKAVSTATVAQIAQNASDIATATNQYFWHDTNGIHVSTDEADPAGARNILINSLGILLRKAANFLMSISENAISFFDGNGNDAENIVAVFGRDGAVIGSNSSSQVIVSNDGLEITDDNHIVIASMRDSQAIVVDSVKKSVKFSYDVAKSTTTMDGISTGSSFSVVCSYTYALDGSTHTSVTSTETFTQGTASTKNLVGNPLGIGDIPIVQVEYELPNMLVFTPRFNSYSTSYNITVEYSNGSFSAPMYSFGTRSDGDGGFSVILGRELEADTDYSVATGKFNDDGNYALMVGNGTADNARSNAFTVAWNGDVEAAGEIADGSGNKISHVAPVQLWTGNTTSSATLSETSASFRSLDFVFTDADGTRYYTQRLMWPNGNSTSLSSVFNGSSIMYISSADVSVAGAIVTITNNNRLQVAFNGSAHVSVANGIKLVGVYGYR